MVSYLENSVNPVIKSETQTGQTMNLAASWYVAMLSKELRKKPQAIELFGRSLVAWRDKAGKAVIMERFCSHLGASLAIGEVVDGCIQCPFHHWRYDSSGVCVHIPKVAKPHTDQIPQTARQKIYVTEERYGYIWIWYGTATPLFDLPNFDTAESNRYMSYRFSFPVKTSVRRVIENAFDHHHFVTLHNLSVTESVELILINDQDVELSELPITKEAWIGCVFKAPIKSFLGVGAIAKFIGLNIETMLLRIDAWPSGFIGTFMSNKNQHKFKLFVNVTPVSENRTIWHVLITIKKTGNLWLDLISYIVFGWQNKAAALEDKLIYANISADTTGAFLKSDQPVLKFRHFYQSWVAKVQ
uniref:Rieske-type oxygenase n=1 Tax=Fischerella sp. SAG 46.79 TaxID=1930929 RepID=A0A1P8VSL4_9CYAN|nr:FisB2 [Fischerella sp. SAG 46.79]AQY10087.1 NifO1 [Fischerella sp. SAG 46.79]